MVFLVHASSISHEGELHKCGVHPHVKGKMHASETLCIFSLESGTNRTIFFLSCFQII